MPFFILPTENYTTKLVLYEEIGKGYAATKHRGKVLKSCAMQLTKLGCCLFFIYFMVFVSF